MHKHTHTHTRLHTRTRMHTHTHTHKHTHTHMRARNRTHTRVHSQAFPPLVLDVGSAEEYAAGHIEQAVGVPLEELAAACK